MRRKDDEKGESAIAGSRAEEVYRTYLRVERTPKNYRGFLHPSYLSAKLKNTVTDH